MGEFLMNSDLKKIITNGFTTNGCCIFSIEDKIKDMTPYGIRVYLVNPRTGLFSMNFEQMSNEYRVGNNTLKWAIYRVVDILSENKLHSVCAKYSAVRPKIPGIRKESIHKRTVIERYGLRTTQVSDDIFLQIIYETGFQVNIIDNTHFMLTPVA